jgi:hypothetical protein
MNKKEGMLFPFFDLFYHIVEENFQKNYDDLVKFIDTKIQENKDKQSNVITGGFYNMNVNLDYVKLKEKILAIREKNNKIGTKTK